MSRKDPHDDDHSGVTCTAQCERDKERTGPRKPQYLPAQELEKGASHCIRVSLKSVAVPWLWSSVADLSPRRPNFAPGSVHVGFAVDKVALGQVFLRVLRFSPVNISFHRSSPNSYHLGNALYANVGRHPRLGLTHPTFREKYDFFSFFVFRIQLFMLDPSTKALFHTC
jgi:hypothetical protein